MIKRRNVYELALVRLEKIFSIFDNVYVSFSGGKDSGVLLSLCIDYIRKNKLTCKLGVFHIDYEVQYEETTRYVTRMLSSNADILDIYRVCVPFKVQTCTSMYQSYWRPWNENQKDVWVRPLPENCYTKEDFSFFSENMWDYEFQFEFSKWLHQRKNAERTCCLVGIRTQESLNRWRVIHATYKVDSNFEKMKWTRKIFNSVYNAYPIYDWLTTDVWTANGKFHWDYNRLYDLYYQAGISLEKQRVASPFISQAQSYLKLYRVIDPNTWGKMINRVNGINFTAIYGGTSAVGWYSMKLPKGYTWAGYMEFLLKTLPDNIRRNYLEKLSVSINFWRNKGGCLSDSTIEKLRKMGISIQVENKSNYKTDKKTVRMEYLDDINLSEFRELPTFKRICICILKNDHACKYMGFALNKNEKERRKKIMEKYQMLL